MDVGSPTLGGAAIPGDPAGLRAIAARLSAAQEDVSSVQTRVASNGLPGWTGSAAGAFRSSLDKLPGELGSVAAAFDGAAGAVNRFAGQLSGFQERAAYFANRIRMLEQELAAAKRSHDAAQSKVQAARLREYAAHDPISLKTAVTAVRYGLSLLHQALDELDLHSQAITRVRNEAQVNREDYENAVRACCFQLQDAGESCTQPSGSSHISVSSLIGGLGLVWAHLEKRPEQLLRDVHDDVDALDQVVKGRLPKGASAGRFGTPIERVAKNPLFKGVGHIFKGVEIVEDGQELFAVNRQTRGQSGSARAVRLGILGAGDAALLWGPAGVANLADGGALKADVDGISLIADGAMTGGLKGALAGDAQFANNAASGKYGGFVKGMANAEDYAIEHPKAALMAVAHAPGQAIGDAAQGADYVVEHPKAAAMAVAHAPAAAAKDLYHGARDLLGEL